MQMSVFWSMTVYIITMAVTPGPNCILSMVNAAQKKFPKCLSLNFGMFFGILIISSIAYCLVSVLVKYMPVIEPILQIAGILYILYIAYCIFKSGEIKIAGSGGDFKTGFILQFMNIKLMLLGISTASNYILPSNVSFALGYLSIIYLSVICLIAGILWAAFGATLSSLYNRKRVLFNCIFGLSLVALAINSLVTFISSH